MAKVNDPIIDSQIHHGRREKLRETFEKFGLDTFNETQVLEFALGFCVPRIDTNPTAHRLINTFGSLPNVVDATPSRLQQVDGIGINQAFFLSFLREFVTYYMRVKPVRGKIQSKNDAVEYLRDVMTTYDNEEFILICLDRQGNIIRQKQVKGTLTRVNLELRDILDILIQTKATAAVIAHNHPDDMVAPSEADIAFTRQIINSFEPLGITLIDHLIFGKSGKFYSFQEQNLITLFQKEHRQFAKSKDWENMLWEGLS